MQKPQPTTQFAAETTIVAVRRLLTQRAGPILVALELEPK
jgi:hypothetical protein